MQDERSPIATSPLSIILTIAGLPGWEEALSSWVTYLNGLNRDYELLLISEKPELSLESLNGKFARGRILPTPEMAGFGAALRRGLESAQHPLVLYTQCDGRYQPQHIQLLLRWIDKVDLIGGYREYPAGVPRPRWRNLAYRLLVRSFFGVRLSDPGCRFLLARRSVFTRIPIQSTGTFAHAEIIAKANFLGCLMQEVALPYQPVPGEEKESNARRTWVEARRLFGHPDFGPPDAKFVLEAPVEQAAEKAPEDGQVAREPPA